jgi:hypothetical protein
MRPAESGASLTAGVQAWLEVSSVGANSGVGCTSTTSVTMGVGTTCWVVTGVGAMTWITGVEGVPVEPVTGMRAATCAQAASVLKITILAIPNKTFLNIFFLLFFSDEFYWLYSIICLLRRGFRAFSGLKWTVTVRK